MADRAPWGRVYQADLWELWPIAHPGGGFIKLTCGNYGRSRTLGAGLSS
ncbi:MULTISPECIES: hypothetical protein [Limnospira]|uniref:Uncharacterized protein n=1 Tax=Limnospira fusiformis PMC 851.14 TaxID=2219512 RepID=A0ABU9EMU5_LIMFS|nr:hypothetical protein [Limnospira indica]QJB24351.1 hypothetical protein HFV01_02360 [Limnospira fusiformis SAG 85.79]QJB24352.1 hypothetical protein HFV01_02365 [Limnospira fusiformis SAG 85.79]QNH60429.1 MAG: hypothetical protein H2674_23905 [Limnospira indica BM01]QNH60430.1 MAG: hypothetical protein H2674_23910 [Limnospira indica BM01]